MKQLFGLLLIALVSSATAQSDTLFFRNQQKVPAKLYEVSEHEIKYRRTDVIDGPIYTVNVQNLLKIKYQNGTEQLFLPDELSVTQDVTEILKQRSAYKFHVFDLPTGKISLGYERVIRSGINSDFKFGIFNSNLLDAFNNRQSYDGRNISIYNRYGARFSGGTFVKAGAKFIFGQDFVMNGMRKSHLLNGAYVRFDVYASYIKYDDIKYYIHTANYSAPWYGPMNATEKTTDGHNYNAGFLVCVGKQHVLANLITLEYYAGMGFNASSYSFTQNDFNENGPINPDGSQYYYYNNSYNVLAAHRLGSYISGTLGFSVGYIHKPKHKQAKTTTTN